MNELIREYMKENVDGVWIVVLKRKGSEYFDVLHNANNKAVINILTDIVEKVKP